MHSRPREKRGNSAVFGKCLNVGAKCCDGAVIDSAQLSDDVFCVHALKLSQLRRAARADELRSA
jgi:hypothetical protein